MVVRRSVAGLLHVRIRNKMLPHKTNLSDPEVEAGCLSARRVQKMPLVRHNTATLTHNTLECTTDSAELNTIASDLWRLCYEHVTNALVTNSTKWVHMIAQVQAFLPIDLVARLCVCTAEIKCLIILIVHYGSKSWFTAKCYKQFV